MALAAAMLCACSDKQSETAERRSVVLVQPHQLDSAQTGSYSGTVSEAHSIGLGFKVAGQINKVYVHEGDRVAKGQLLASLDAADYALTVEALQIQYDQAKREVERMALLHKQKSMADNDYEKAVSGLRQLGAQLQQGKNQLSYTRLYAPCSGYVQTVNFAAAEQVGAGTPVLTVLDMAAMEVDTDIPASEYRQLGVFGAFHCRVEGIDATYAMRLLSIAPKADATQLYRVRLAFEGKPDARITAGLNAEVSISKQAAHSVGGARGFAIPLNAVFEDEQGRPAVWVMRPDSTLTKRNVALNPAVHAGEAVVDAGLNGNELIVGAGAATLQEGERVVPLGPNSKTNVGGLL